MTGRATFVLHSHLPYCRLAGRWPHGEEWLHEATLECYLPLIRAFTRLARETRGALGVTINMTPVLTEQIADPLMREHFRSYLADRIERAAADVERFAASNDSRAKTASFHHDRYRAIRHFYEDEIGADPVGALAALEAGGHIEIATCAATHAYLPLLDTSEAIRFQVQAGIDSHVRNFGRRPRSFWLPECAYEPGLEEYLEEAGIKVFFVETHLITGGQARGKALGAVVGPYPELQQRVHQPVTMASRPATTFQPYAVGSSAVSVFGRNERTGLQVWSAAHGYPGDAVYREFHKKEDTSGLHYWRVTGRGVDLGDKAEYDHEAANRRMQEHASHFRELVKSELYLYEKGSGMQGTVVAAYDTELLGHWWLEGIDWLEWTLRGLAGDPHVELISAADNIDRNPPAAAISLPEGSWGAGGDHRTWMNPDTAWTWPEIHARQRRALRLLSESNDATRQLARELLLLQSSDWQFLMTTGQAHDYAMERFRSHLERFDELAQAIETGSPALPTLTAEYAALDNPFPGIDPRLYGSRPQVLHVRP